jgi:hypothetical protein
LKVPFDTYMPVRVLISKAIKKIKGIESGLLIHRDFGLKSRLLEATGFPMYKLFPNLGFHYVSLHGTEFRVPYNADEWLEILYGDWRKPIKGYADSKERAKNRRRKK